MSRPMSEPLEARRRRVLDAARKALMARNFEDASLDEVARRAGIAKGTLYLYFKNKEELFARVFEDIVYRLGEYILHIPSQKNAVGVLRHVASEHIKFTDEYRDFIIQLQRRMPENHKSPACRIIEQGMMRHFEIIGRIIQNCVREKAIKPCHPMSASIYFISLIRMFILEKTFFPAKKSIKSRTDAFMNYLLHGLGAGSKA